MPRMPVKPVLPVVQLPYSTAQRLFVYRPHWQHVYAKGTGTVGRHMTADRRIVVHGRHDDIPFMDLSTADSEVGALPLTKHLHPLWRELTAYNLQPWFLDPNLVLQRKRYDRLASVHDILHILLYRKPPPGPWFFYPEPNSPTFREVVKFYHYYDPRYSPSTQKDKRASSWLMNYKMHHFKAPELCWFNPENPWITWDAKHYVWRARMDFQTRKFRNNYSPFNYWKACRDLLLFIGRKNVTARHVTYLTFEHLIPKSPEEPGNRRAVLLGQRYLGLPRSDLPEHPRDPMWVAAIQQREVELQLKTYSSTRRSANKDFIESLDLSEW